MEKGETLWSFSDGNVSLRCCVQSSMDERVNPLHRYVFPVYIDHVTSTNRLPQKKTAKFAKDLLIEMELPAHARHRSSPIPYWTQTHIEIWCREFGQKANWGINTRERGSFQTDGFVPVPDDTATTTLFLDDSSVIEIYIHNTVDVVFYLRLFVLKVRLCVFDVYCYCLGIL